MSHNNNNNTQQQQQQLPIDADGVCMMCGQHPPEEDKLICTSCASPWHPSCVVNPPQTLALVPTWECPDCSGVVSFEPIRSNDVVVSSSSSCSIVAKTREIEADESLTAEEKARKRQELLTGSTVLVDDEENVDDNFKCCCCMQLLVKPISMSCGHNACLKCFQVWVNKGNHTCMTCRREISKSMISQPRINASLVEAIRLSRTSNESMENTTSHAYQTLDNENRPDAAFTTVRAQRKGLSNAASGKVFVQVPRDHFGPILPEHDPVKNRGVLVGDKWASRLECRQWGVHRPHVSGIAGQGKYGAQSVVLAGGYEDDEDHGEWFLYTGSGGRDLGGNKRTNKLQSFDQCFTNYNSALSVSCLKGYPVRVVRSSKDKRSSHAPEKENDKDLYRYDGIYRVEKYWMKVGTQNYKVCRFLFVRCDNAPAPWSSDEHGDMPRNWPPIPELAQAENVIERSEGPSWDFDVDEGIWKWTMSPPPSRMHAKSKSKNQKRQQKTAANQLKKAFSCKLCKKVLSSPVTTPCAHNFCKPCLEDAFSGQSEVRERSSGGRSLRSRNNIFKCLSCPTDISDFLKNLQVNRELENAIEVLKKKAEDMDEIHEKNEDNSVDKYSGSAENDDTDGEDDEEEDDDDDNDNGNEEVEEEEIDISNPKRHKMDNKQEISSSSASENAVNGL